jgi:hypothetical protein
MDDIPDLAKIRKDNEERVRISQALVKMAKAEGQDLKALKYAATLAGREDALPHIEEAWKLFGGTDVEANADSTDPE